MRVVSFLISNGILLDKNDRYSVVPESMIILPEIPSCFSFDILIALSDIYKKGFELSVDLLNPKNNVIDHVVIDVTPVPGDTPEYARVGLSSHVHFQNTLFKEEGDYKVVISADGTMIDEFIIPVCKYRAPDEGLDNKKLN